jgi:hypothetical protein
MLFLYIIDGDDDGDGDIREREISWKKNRSKHLLIEIAQIWGTV